MENNNSLEVFHKGEILDCNFERVDFNNPETLLRYAGGVKDEISKIFDTTAEMALESKEITLDEKTLSLVSSFDESLEESEKEKEKLAKQPAIIKGLKGLLSNIGITKIKEDEEFETTYKGRYQKYCEGIEKVCEAIELQKQASLNDISLRNAIVKELTPHIVELEHEINVGKLDKEAYDKQTEEIKKQPQTQDTLYEIQYRTQLSEVFGGKINELEKALVLFKEQVQSYRLQQRTDMELVMKCDSYLDDTAPVLKAQGSIMVFNRQQENRITQMSKLNEATNTAIVNNAKNLEKNIQGAVELSLNSGVSVNTLEIVDSSLKKGIELFKQGREKRQQQIAKEKQDLLNLNNSLDNYQKELLQLIDEDGVMQELLKDDSKSITRKRY